MVGRQALRAPTGVRRSGTGVVVVLDDDCPRSAAQRITAARFRADRTDPGGPLVRGRRDHRVGPAVPQPGDLMPLASTDPVTSRFSARAAGRASSGRRVSSASRRAARGQHAHQQRHAPRSRCRSPCDPGRPPCRGPGSGKAGMRATAPPPAQVPNHPVGASSARRADCAPRGPRSDIGPAVVRSMAGWVSFTGALTGGAAGLAATCVYPPARLARYPRRSAAGRLTTTPREISRSAASVRDGGEDPRASRPARIASRIDVSICRCSGTPRYWSATSSSD